MSDKNSEPSKQEIERLSLEAFDAACLKLKPLRGGDGECLRASVRHILAAFDAVHRADRVFRASFARRNQGAWAFDTIEVLHIVASAFLNEIMCADPPTAFHPHSVAGNHLWAFVKASQALSLRAEVDCILDDPGWFPGAEFASELLEDMPKNP